MEKIVIKPSKFHIEFINNDIAHLFEREEPYFASAILVGGMCCKKDIKEKLGVPVAPIIFNRNKDLFYLKSIFDKFGDLAIKKLDKPGYSNKIVRECKIAGKKLISDAKNIFKKSQKTDDMDKLASLLEEFYRKAKKYCGYYAVTVFQKPMTEFAEKITNKYAQNESQKEEIFPLITSPSSITDPDLEQDSFLKICVTKKNGQDISKLIKDHLKKVSLDRIEVFSGWTLVGRRYYQ